MCKQYWADASTKNCVWVFQIKETSYGENGCTCDAFDGEGELKEGRQCTCAIESWRTEAVFLTKEEAMNHGRARPYAWGEYEFGWRIWGVPCHGLMVELLGRHAKEFESKVEYIG